MSEEMDEQVLTRSLLKCALHMEEGEMPFRKEKKSVFRNSLGNSTGFDLKSLAAMSAVSPAGDLGLAPCCVFLSDYIIVHSSVTYS